MISSAFIYLFGQSAIFTFVSAVLYVIGRFLYACGSCSCICLYLFSIPLAIAGAPLSVPLLVLYLLLRWIVKKASKSSISSNPPDRYLDAVFPGISIRRWHIILFSLLYICSIVASCYLSYSVYLSYDDGYYSAVQEYEPVIDALEDQIREAGEDVDNGAYAQSSSDSSIVYITDTGDKYHRRYCSYLHSSHALRKSDAIQKDYSPCSRCDP